MSSEFDSIAPLARRAERVEALHSERQATRLETEDAGSRSEVQLWEDALDDGLD